jgi:hypothetical protein
MNKPADAEYYVPNRTEHVSQGDIFRGFEFNLPGDEKFGFAGYGMLVTYTSGMMNQPPGTRGYQHDYRLVAPILPLAILPELGVKEGKVERIRSEDPYTHFMYLPAHPPDFEESVVLPYRPTLVLQEQLTDRVTQLLEPAARQLQVKLFGAFLGGKPENPERDLHPDMADHWNDF